MAINKVLRIILIIAAVVCFGVALSYPLLYNRQSQTNENNISEYQAIRNSAKSAATTAIVTATPVVTTALPTATPTPTDIPTPTPSPAPIAAPEIDMAGMTEEEYRDILFILDYTPLSSGTPKPTHTPRPTATPRVYETPSVLPYPLKEKVELDESKILPDFQELYGMNQDLIGWITIENMTIDYPVVQSDDPDFYLTHGFDKEENVSGMIILDPLCDPYTPSYNLVISGHHMNNGQMFTQLTDFKQKSFWKQHRFIEFDNLMEKKQFVIFAAFDSADWDVDEQGFRYNQNVQYKLECDQWLKEIRENQLYDTGIQCEFGDEFITLTTCNRAKRKNGRFVVVARRIRDGETFE